MASLIYGSPGTTVQFDDRTLAHLRVVLLAKLRREEKFALNFTDSVTANARTLWFHPAIALQFEFDSSAEISLNRAWVDALTASANSGAGLRVVAEESIGVRSRV
ncbi:MULTISPECIES: hypothetical protein [Subtercola]|uniref:DUF7882 domain-containing protein n=1 Tax=Subtercola vilae TaxID=2056433 RepID=A0A4T2CDR8_9MICO|nr:MULTISPECIES: hypothetical protein [Subtercola]MEA9987239.1 hypothetical protein [Subtercola sp. RTI3]TIH40458.1 hypothetical protein D4765_02625 [Subtercola vilae]